MVACWEAKQKVSRMRIVILAQRSGWKRLVGRGLGYALVCALHTSLHFPLLPFWGGEVEGVCSTLFPLNVLFLYAFCCFLRGAFVCKGCSSNVQESPVLVTFSSLYNTQRYFPTSLVLLPHTHTRTPVTRHSSFTMSGAKQGTHTRARTLFFCPDRRQNAWGV